MQSRITKPFEINTGVRQGCVLSPLLFNIFMADLAKKFDEVQDQLRIGKLDVNSIFWADDIIMFAKDENQMREMLKILEEFSVENKLQINTDKTKTMILIKRGDEACFLSKWGTFRKCSIVQILRLYPDTI